MEKVSDSGKTGEEWNNILELFFDEESKMFAAAAKEEGIPAPEEDHVGLELEGADGEVAATIEIGWPERNMKMIY